MSVELVLIRGLPGSGKSTLAKSLPQHIHVENDMYFMQGDKYMYEPDNMYDAIQWCYHKTKDALEQNQSVVVTNTFVRRFEWEPYVAMAWELNVPVRFFEAKGSYKNVHNVPDDVIQKMTALWEPLPDSLKPDRVENALFDLTARKLAKQVYVAACYMVTTTHEVSMSELLDAEEDHASQLRQTKGLNK